MPPDLETLTSQCTTMGVAVTWARLPDGLAGCYHHATRTIVLDRRLEDWQAVPVLMHEMAHAAAGHDGHQDAATEARIDRTVATTLLSIEEYQQAEALVGPHLGALATELEVPAWVVTAYQTVLSTMGQDPPHRVAWTPLAG